MCQSSWVSKSKFGKEQAREREREKVGGADRKESGAHFG